MKLLLGVFDVLDDIADTLEFFGLFIGHFDAELLFQGHDELDGIERVRAEILDKLGFRSDLIRFYAQLFDDNIFNPLVYWFVCHIYACFSS